MINGSVSAPFDIHNGTRQGCPLSPLLFVTQAPLLHYIWTNSVFSGLSAQDYHHKVAAYADNLLFYITNPIISLPTLPQELHTYGALTNFKMNHKKKSVAISVCLDEHTLKSLRPSFPFHWALQSIRYLGTHIPADPSLIFKINCLPLLHSLWLTWILGLTMRSPSFGGLIS